MKISVLGSGALPSGCISLRCPTTLLVFQSVYRKKPGAGAAIMSSAYPQVPEEKKRDGKKGEKVEEETGEYIFFITQLMKGLFPG